jgi:WAS protein family, member 3
MRYFFFYRSSLYVMPFNKRTVEPINLSRVQVPNDIPNELQCVANQTLANVIRQLSSLSAHCTRFI